jgi:hypothetical protein
MGDAAGLLDSIHRVCKVGRENGYFWKERYTEKGGHGVGKYCEYPANLIRIVQRFLLGVDLRLDGALVLAPTVPEDFWEKGFGQTLAWRDRTLHYQMGRDRVTGTYAGGAPQRLGVRLPAGAARAAIDGRDAAPEREGELVFVTLPAAPESKSCRFEVGRRQGEGR